jgi:NADH:ubiquinone oxidoreductase subunit F (NADH-binding)
VSAEPTVILGATRETARSGREGHASATAAGAGELPRLLRGVQSASAPSLAGHVRAHGPLPAPQRGAGGRWSLRGRERALPLVDDVERAGLLGRGGAAFPTATKMRAVAAARGRPVLVANGAEGEPASLKDKTLLELAPHLVLDGAALAAEAVGADAIIVAVGDDADEALMSVQGAIAERESAGVEEPRTSVVSVPDHYVAGQEMALINWINGGRAKPTFTPPMAFEAGVSRRPTLVNNVETLAHVALVARHGPEWFRALGTAGHTGSALVTVWGPLGAPGVYEIECGASLTSLIQAAGGATAGVSAALVGGYAGGWVGPAHLRSLALSDEHLAAHGAALGAGAVLLLSEHTCPVAETARLARWMAGQSAGQCGPCIHGLDALATAVSELARGEGSQRQAQRIERLAALTARRGACRHPDGAVRMVLSALETFGGEFADHARHGPCDACAHRTELPLPDRPVSDRAARDRR